MEVLERKEFNQPMDQLITHIRKVYELQGTELTDKQVVELITKLAKERL